MRGYSLWLSGLIFLAVPHQAVRAESPIILDLQPSVQTGIVPSAWAPSTAAIYSDPALISGFITNAKHIGCIRTLNISSALQESTNMATYVQRLGTLSAGTFAQITNRGGRVVAVIAGMPPWLSTSTNQSPAGTGGGFTISQASPPSDYAAWADVVSNAVNRLNNELGQDIYYECWNEPDLTNYWRGSVAEYQLLYQHFVMGARSADPSAKVGGPAVSAHSAAISSTNPATSALILALAQYAATNPVPALGLDRLPIDFVSWHEYNAMPDATLSANAARVRGWITSAGYSSTTPLIVDEWHITGGPSPNPHRDSEVAAAYSAAMINALAQAGVDGQSMFAFQDDAVTSNLFHGGYGSLTRSPAIVRKSTYFLHELLDHFAGGSVVSSAWASTLSKPQAVQLGHLVVRQGDRTELLLWSFTPPPLMYMVAETTRILTRLQQEDPQQLRDALDARGLSSALDLLRFLPQALTNGQMISSFPLNTYWKDQLLEARRVSLQLGEAATNTLSVLVHIPEFLKQRPAYQHRVIDRFHSNPYYHYTNALPNGVDEAVAAAVSNQSLETVAQSFLGSDGWLGPIAVRPYSVHWITFQTSDPSDCTLLHEDFTPPSAIAWSVLPANTLAPRWRADNPARRTPPGNYTNDYAIADSAFYGPVPMDTELRTPTLDLTEFETVRLAFNMDFPVRPGYGTEIADVDASTNGLLGPWTNIARWTGNSVRQATNDLDLSGLLAGRQNVALRWRYHAASNDYWWALDNIRISGQLRQANPDSDQNGLPDWWESAMFQGRANVQPDADDDGDQASNLEEYIAGTDPTNDLSCLSMESWQSDNGLVLRWPSVANRMYDLVRCSNLLEGFTYVVGSNIAAQPPVNTYTDTTINAGGLYFHRVRVHR